MGLRLTCLSLNQVGEFDFGGHVCRIHPRHEVSSAYFLMQKFSDTAC